MPRINIQPEEILGLPAGASRDDISRARGELAKILHPDVRKGGNTALMQLINHAVEVLLSGQGGYYSFSGDPQPGNAGPNPGEQSHGGWNPGGQNPGGQNPGGQNPGEEQYGRNRKTCDHPKKPGYSRCFECSGVKLCPVCQTGYYGPPNDRCRICRGARGQR